MRKWFSNFICEGESWEGIQSVIVTVTVTVIVTVTVTVTVILITTVTVNIDGVLADICLTIDICLLQSFLLSLFVVGEL